MATVPTKTARFLASFKSVEILPAHRNHGDESPCLRDCGIPAAVASKLIAWAESSNESLVCTLESGTGGRVRKCWHWKEAFLQSAFKRHTELFGDADLSPQARLMRDTGSCFN